VRGLVSSIAREGGGGGESCICFAKYFNQPWEEKLTVRVLGPYDLSNNPGSILQTGSLWRRRERRKEKVTKVIRFI